MELTDVRCRSILDATAYPRGGAGGPPPGGHPRAGGRHDRKPGGTGAPGWRRMLAVAVVMTAVTRAAAAAVGAAPSATTADRPSGPAPAAAAAVATAAATAGSDAGVVDWAAKLPTALTDTTSPADARPSDLKPSEDAKTSAILEDRWRQWRAAAAGPRLLSPAAGGESVDDGLEARQAATALVLEELRSLNASLPPPATPSPLLPESAAEAVRAAVALHREAELAALSSGLVPGLGMPRPPSQPERDVAAGRFAQWADDVAALAVDFRLAGPAVGTLWTLDNVSGRGDPRDRWGGRLTGDLDVLAGVRAARGRLDKLAALREQTRPALLSLARTGPDLEARYGAYQALEVGRAVDPPWLSQVGDLAADDELREQLYKLQPGAGAGAGAGAVGGPPAPARLPGDAAVRERWRTFAAAAGDKARAEEAAASLAKRAGGSAAAMLDEIKAAALAVEPRFNLTLAAARSLLTAPAASPDEALAPALDAVRQAAAELPKRPGVGADPAAALLRRLAEREPFRGAATGDRFDLKLPDGQTAVPFVLVKPAGRRAFYLTADEVSAGQFFGAVQTRDAPPRPLRPQVLQLLRAADKRVVGPRVWRIDGPPDRLAVGAPNGGGVVPKWFPESRNDFAESLRPPDAPGNESLLGPAAGGPPTDAHPMQQVPPGVALYVALLLDCRLPTTQEWALATDRGVAGSAAGKDKPRDNLRDKTWEVQQQHARRLRRGEPNAPIPIPPFPDAPYADEGSFFPKKVLKGPAGEGDAAVARPVPDDGTLYFRPAVPPPDKQVPAFRNLVGNVAEVVFDAPDALAGLPDPAKLAWADVQGLLKTAGDRLRVVGLSALSAPEMKPAEPYPVDADTPFADVGFRLAFTAPFQTNRDRLQWVVGDQPYLPLAVAR